MNELAQDHTVGVQESWAGKLCACDSKANQHEGTVWRESPPSFQKLYLYKVTSELIGFMGSQSRQSGSHDDDDLSHAGYILSGL